MLILDTFDYARKLQKVGFSEEQAAVQVEALRTLVEHDLATKQDIANVQRDIAEIYKEVETLRKETQQSIEALRKETQQSIEALRKETQQSIEALRKETQLGQTQIVADLRKDIALSKAETLKWIAGMLIAQSAVVASLVKLL